ncbi:hypothetical protein [Carnobacterium maltaromaticum]|uniref:hypothetical protein n=1 Tax=Carnobacterium maltaromaticum TaxID=2751 RepID=UPI0012F80E77|nr:hypothetical protein [Carnobacterium maltaromaticum]
MKETEMFAPVKTMLLEEMACDEVYGEIANFDVVGFCGPADIVVEMKTALNFKVIEQAYRALKYAHYVYIAVPKPKGSHRFIYHEMLAPKGIGLVYVGKDWVTGEDRYIAEVSHQARFNHSAVQANLKRHENAYRLRGQITEWSNKNIGGSKSGETITDYSETIRKVKEFLASNGWSTLQQILDNCETHYANPEPSLRATLHQPWNKSWIESKKDERTVFYKIK